MSERFEPSAPRSAGKLNVPAARELISWARRTFNRTFSVRPFADWTVTRSRSINRMNHHPRPSQLVRLIGLRNLKRNTADLLFQEEALKKDVHGIAGPLRRDPVHPVQDTERKQRAAEAPPRLQGSVLPDDGAQDRTGHRRAIQTNEVVGFQRSRTNYHPQYYRTCPVSLAHWRTCVHRSSRRDHPYVRSLSTTD